MCVILHVSLNWSPGACPRVCGVAVRARSHPTGRAGPSATGVDLPMRVATPKHSSMAEPLTGSALRMNGCTFSCLIALPGIGFVVCNFAKLRHIVIARDVIPTRDSGSGIGPSRSRNASDLGQIFRLRFIHGRTADGFCPMDEWSYLQLSHCLTGSWVWTLIFFAFHVFLYLSWSRIRHTLHLLG